MKDEILVAYGEDFTGETVRVVKVIIEEVRKQIPVVLWNDRRV